MKFGGGNPMDPNGPIGQEYSPGSIRNTLGSGLKASGIFQKDGQIHNSRGGFIGMKQQPPQGMVNQGGVYNQGGQGGMYNQAQPRQLILQAAQQGITGNGVATISPDNIFLLIANLPVPQTFLGSGQTGTYAAYLVDEKGKTGFLVGTLRQVGDGVFRAHFQSPVPLHHYNRVVVSVENPSQLGHVPRGPIILKVKDSMGMMTFLGPMKNTATSIWGKVSGLIGGKKAPQVSPEIPPVSPEFIQSLNQINDAQPPVGP